MQFDNKNAAQKCKVQSQQRVLSMGLSLICFLSLFLFPVKRLALTV